ncbi:hypothetical protein ACLPHD_21110 [Serratia odorifera]|uniref:hypothetical protein n=1 Tax=Serratia odorifera TaxID=618 RepID=UPI003D2CA3D5
MKSRETVLRPNKIIYLQYIFLFGVAISCLFSSESGWFSVFIFINMFGFILSIITPSARLITRKFLERRISKNRIKISRYESSIICLYAATVLMVVYLMLTECYLIYDYPLSILFVSVFLMIISAYLYILNPKGGLDDSKKRVVWLARIISLVIVYCIYSFSKYKTMEYMDVTYEFASSRIITYVFFIVALAFLLFLLSGFIYIFIICFENKSVEGVFTGKNGKVHYFLRARYDALPIAFPLAVLIVLISIHLVKHKNEVEIAFMKESIELDSSARFYCGGEYKTFRRGLTARFVKLTDSDYRAFIFNGEKIDAYRLSCIDAYPYYKLNYILHDEVDVRVQMRVDELITDINHIRTGKSRKGKEPLLSSPTASIN